METGPRLKVSSDRLVKPGIEPATPGLQGKRFIHYITAAPTSMSKIPGLLKASPTVFKDKLMKTTDRSGKILLQKS